jgi:dephospho-CoA kinase
MSARWTGKYVIGLTGNIATGKSVVRKMLEHLGAFGIDADALSHQAIGRGGPGYGAVVEMFGKWLLNAEGQINRAKLARIVFSDPEALGRLEAIIHPLVSQGIDFLARRTKSSVVVIEAIKLIESGLARDCDAIWTVHVPEALQEARLVSKRGLTPAEARQRIAAQGSQAEKLKAARVTIDNSGSFEDTWLQVQAAFNKIMRPLPSLSQITTQGTRPIGAAAQAAAAPAVSVRRGMPSDATAIAGFIQQASQGRIRLTRGEVMAAFGDKAYFLADYDGNLSALAGWKVENLVARVDEVYVNTQAPLDRLVPPLIDAVENAARELQSEAALVFVPHRLAGAAGQALASRGFAAQPVDKLGVAAWMEAAKESMPAGSALLFKKLREDRVLRPI